jgi:hypothetical protein
VARDALLIERSRGPFVSLLDSTGAVRRVLVAAPRTGQDPLERPLIAQGINEVRLSGIARDRFLVWYPFDNYVTVFDADGNLLRSVAGCLPETIREFYTSQPGGVQFAVPITVGAGVDRDSRVRILSVYKTDTGTFVVRSRIYDDQGAEISSIDIEEPGLRTIFDRYEYVNDSVLLSYSASLPEAGIRKINPGKR